MPTHSVTPNVLCIGEVLWDCLPTGKYPGGAPMNVAYHLTKLGCTAWPVSSVGDDELGNHLLRRLREWGVPCDLVGIDQSRPTGIVNVTLKNGSPSYDIVENVAWDHIPFPNEHVRLLEGADALIFGSLAMRGNRNRLLLGELMQRAPSAFTVFDVNLRPPFDDHQVVWELARQAHLVKLNDEEIDALLGERNDTHDLEARARQFADRIGCHQVSVTAGSDGAGLLRDGEWFWASSNPVVVSDTIGAGDSFLAVLVAGLLQTPDQPQQILERACRLAGFVASRSGATPEHEFDP
ncbi:MAG: carbohydrate kinase [Pseudomonadota bacterium]